MNSLSKVDALWPHDDADAANEYHPSIGITCRFTSETGTQSFVYSVGVVSYRFACPGDHGVAVPRYACKPLDGKPQVPCECGNPIDIAAGAKVQRETDFALPNGFSFTRFYSSKIPNDGNQTIGGWRHAYERTLSSSVTTRFVYSAFIEDRNHWGWPSSAPALGSVIFKLADGTNVPFLGDGSAQNWQSDSAINYRLKTELDSSGKITEWRLTTPDDTIEIYDRVGKLTSIIKRSGRVENLLYSDTQTDPTIAPKANLLLSVTDNFGHALTFRYNGAGRLISVADSVGAIYAYNYDANDALSTVVYPNGLQRQYLYNEPAYQPDQSNASLNHLLTGIVDEISSGQFERYATFSYVNAAPYSTEHNGGLEKYITSGTTVYGPLGSKTDYSFSSIDGVNHLTYVYPSQPDGSFVFRYFAYDENGNLLLSWDLAKVKTSYSYNSRNLEVKRVEAAETWQARTYSTTWHGLLRLPTSVTEPLRRTTYSYDAMGNELIRTVYATDDATGAQGELARNVGAGRTWTSTYDANGKITSRTGPRAGGIDRTEYAYDASGNLVSVRNALGQSTLYSNYDANGRVGRIQSPNGVFTTLDYTTRGWLQHQTVVAGGASHTTTYSYDGVGQLTRVDMPDGASIRYTYDGARRLVGVADALGNKIDYTLDAAGNRLSEKTSDPSGALTLLATRQFDNLGRLQQQTGAAQ